MKNRKTIGLSAFCLAALLLVSGMLTGCSSLSSPFGPPGTETAPAGAGAMYYDFGDVLIPGELEENRKGSYIIQSHGFTAGVLSFSGRVDRGSLIAFFRENMAKDNWKPIASFTSSRTILIFQKQNRWCVINITEGDFYTNVEVGVVPTIGDAGYGG